MDCQPLKVMQIDIRNIIESKNAKLSKWIPNFLIKKFEKILELKKINYFLEHHSDDSAIDFARNAIDYVEAKIDVRNEENIPETGRYIIVSNHPLGGIDGIALISIVGRHRKDIKFPVNDFLLHLKPMREIFIPINKVGKNSLSSMKEFNEAFESDNLILYFPAGLCSRKENGIIRDLDWKKTVIKKARETHRDIIPAYFDGKNSEKFYRIARWRKRLKIKFNIEMMYLPAETFNQKGETFTVTFGKPISYDTFDKSKNDVEWAAWLKEQVYSLTK